MGIIERKQREKERRRNEILTAARIVFQRHGYKDAAIKEIATEAQLSPGTIYLYFRNKEELYAALSIDVLQFLLDKSSKTASKRNTSIEKRLREMGQIYLDMYDYDAKALIHLFHLQSAETLSRLSPEIVEKIKSLSFRAHNDLVGIIKEGMDLGLLKQEHPVAVADALWGTFTGVVLWLESKRYLNPAKDFVKSTLESAMTVFFNGLRV